MQIKLDVHPDERAALRRLGGTAAVVVISALVGLASAWLAAYGEAAVWVCLWAAAATAAGVLVVAVVLLCRPVRAR